MAIWQTFENIFWKLRKVFVLKYCRRWAVWTDCRWEFRAHRDQQCELHASDPGRSPVYASQKHHSPRPEAREHRLCERQWDAHQDHRLWIGLQTGWVFSKCIYSCISSGTKLDLEENSSYSLHSHNTLCSTKEQKHLIQSKNFYFLFTIN